MKKLIPKALLIAVLGTAAGAVINLATYAVFGRPVLSKCLSGGEWTGYVGFGVLMNHTFPMTIAGEDASGNIWLSFDPWSLITAFIWIFVAAVIVLLILNRLKRKGEI